MRPSTFPAIDFYSSLAFGSTASVPLTFRSRGVALPFTTPGLAGSRVRASKHNGVELVVPNPSGSRGIYILDWSGIRTVCNPTVHDTLLFQRVRCLPDIQPAIIRHAALEVACEGYAGREAAAAAEFAIARDLSQRALVRFLLITALVEPVSVSGRRTAVAHEQPAELDRRGTAMLQRIASSAGRPAAPLDVALTAIADLLAPVGMASADRGARIPRLLMRLDQACGGLARWLSADPANDVGGLGEAVGLAMQQACVTGIAVLRQTRSAMTETPALLKRWARDPAGLTAAATRCDWLLDGWERVALLWLAAETMASRRAALLEMAPLVPVLPHEVLEWTDMPVAAEAMRQTCRVTCQQDTWRTGGSAIGLIERNEKLIALSALDAPSDLVFSGR